MRKVAEIKVSEEQIRLAENLAKAASDLTGYGTESGPTSKIPAELEFQVALVRLAGLVNDYRQLIIDDTAQMGVKLDNILKTDN